MKVTGENFSPASVVTVGGKPATCVLFSKATESNSHVLEFKSPPMIDDGLYSIEITNPDGAKGGLEDILLYTSDSSLLQVYDEGGAKKEKWTHNINKSSSFEGARGRGAGAVSGSGGGGVVPARGSAAELVAGMGHRKTRSLSSWNTGVDGAGAGRGGVTASVAEDGDDDDDEDPATSFSFLKLGNEKSQTKTETSRTKEKSPAEGGGRAGSGIHSYGRWDNNTHNNNLNNNNTLHPPSTSALVWGRDSPSSSLQRGREEYGFEGPASKSREPSSLGGTSFKGNTATPTTPTTTPFGLDPTPVKRFEDGFSFPTPKKKTTFGNFGTGGFNG